MGNFKWSLSNEQIANRFCFYININILICVYSISVEYKMMEKFAILFSYISKDRDTSRKKIYVNFVDFSVFNLIFFILFYK